MHHRPFYLFASHLINHLATQVLNALACHVEMLLVLVAEGGSFSPLPNIRVRLISCFKPLPAKLNPGKAIRWGRWANGREEARGLSIHHSAGSRSALLRRTCRQEGLGLMEPTAYRTQLGLRGKKTHNQTCPRIFGFESIHLWPQIRFVSINC